MLLIALVLVLVWYTLMRLLNTHVFVFVVVIVVIHTVVGAAYDIDAAVSVVAVVVIYRC